MASWSDKVITESYKTAHFTIALHSLRFCRRCEWLFTPLFKTKRFTWTWKSPKLKLRRTEDVKWVWCVSILVLSRCWLLFVWCYYIWIKYIPISEINTIKLWKRNLNIMEPGFKRKIVRSLGKSVQHNFKRRCTC